MNENVDLAGNGQAESLNENGSGQKAQYDIDLILDIPLDLSVELGKVKMLVNDLLQLGQGSIVDLEKPAGEPLDIYVNAKLVARGEVVVVDEKYGIRVIDVVSPSERVESLS
jgi:flagellar motor switch protein FliN/FliY